MIAMYDLEDNLITVFDGYKDCAEYFNTTRDVIKSYICKSKKGIVDRKRDTANKRWCRLYKIEEE